MLITLLILTFTIAAFIQGRLRGDIVALIALSALMLFGIITPTEALSGFSSPVVIMMVGLFVVGGAILQTGLAKAVSQRIMRLAAGNETRMFILVMLTTSFIGAFVSNTGTVALLMPIVISMCKQSGTSPSRLLMPMAFAGSLGGMLTLIGTPPNLVIHEALVDAGYSGMTFFGFLPIGLIAITVGIVVLLPMSRYILGRNKRSAGHTRHEKSADMLMEEYQLQHLAACRISDKSKLKGHTIGQLNLQQRYGLTILEIRRTEHRRRGIFANVNQNMAWADTTLTANDLLFVMGREEDFQRLLTDYQLERIEDSQLGFYDIGVAELVVMPSSKLDGLTVRDSNLRQQHNLNVLGIRRQTNRIVSELGNERIHAGDVLLVQSTWENIQAATSQTEDWVILGQPEQQAQRATIDYKAPLAALIMLVMIVMMVFDFIPVSPVTAVILAGLLTVLGGCFRNVEAAYRTINWESIVMIAAMMPMSTALEKTGVSSLVSEFLVSSLGGFGPTILLAGIYLTTSIMTMFISNTATAVLMAPIAMSAASSISVNPYAYLLAVTLGASMCFASPFSTPPNALVMRAGQYSFMDYVKVGLPLQLIMGIVMTLVLPLLFPF